MKPSERQYALTRSELGVVISSCRGAPLENGQARAPRSRRVPHSCKHILAACLMGESNARP